MFRSSFKKVWYFRNEYYLTHQSVNQFNIMTEGYDEKIQVRKFKCSKCSLAFSEESLLKRHFDILHCDANKQIKINEDTRHLHGYKCDHCGKILSRAVSLRDHINFVHKGMKPLKCDICGKNFARKTDLKSHMPAHVPKCKLCFKLYSTLKCTLKCTLKSDTPKCNLCFKNFATLKCVTCGKFFESEKCLKIHKNNEHQQNDVREGEKTFNCDLCGETFKQIDRLKCHIKIHMNDYKCKICGKGFCTSESLILHEKSAHY